MRNNNLTQNLCFIVNNKYLKFSKICSALSKPIGWNSKHDPNIEGVALIIFSHYVTVPNWICKMNYYGNPDILFEEYLKNLQINTQIYIKS